MSKKKKNIYSGILVLVLILLFFSFKPINPEGTYVAKYFENTIDTIQVHKDGNYTRSIYKRLDGELMFENTGKWKFKKNRLYLDSFYENDDELKRINYNYDNVLLTAIYPLERIFFVTYFSVNEESSRYIYFKLLID